MRLSKFGPEFGLARADVENWMLRSSITLRTEYSDTRAGQPREFSRMNVLELAIMKALVTVGCKPSSAAAFGEIVLDGYRARRLKRWLVLPAGDFKSAVPVDDLAEVNLGNEARRSPVRAIVFIDVKDIVDRVDRIFAEGPSSGWPEIRQ